LPQFWNFFGFNGYPNDGRSDFEGCGWSYAIAIWIWTAYWFLLLDPLKFTINYVWRKGGQIFSRDRELALDDDKEDKQLKKSKDKDAKKDDHGKEPEKQEAKGSKETGPNLVDV